MMFNLAVSSTIIDCYGRGNLANCKHEQIVDNTDRGNGKIQKKKRNPS
jgi:hypothetical protein